MSSTRSSWNARRTRCLALLAPCFLGACSSSAPPTGRFTRVADMLTPRTIASAARLPDGRIIVVGGLVGTSIKDPASQTSSTEIYDAGSNQWTSAAPVPLRVPVVNTLASLSSGLVLAVGQDQTSRGISADSLRSYLYDPASDRWIETGHLPAEAQYWANLFSNAVELSDGRVLIAGGFSFDSGIPPYDPTATISTSKVSLLFTPNATDPALGSWDFTRDGAGNVTQMQSPHELTPMVKLKDGRVLVCGGRSKAAGTIMEPIAGSAACDLFDPATGTWTSTLPMPAIAGEDGPGSADPGSRINHIIAGLPSGEVLIAGGGFFTTDTALGYAIRRSSLLFDPKTPASPWKSAPDLNEGVESSILLSPVAGGILPAVGGDKIEDTIGDFLDTAVTQLFDPAERAWRFGADLPKVHPYWADSAGLAADYQGPVVSVSVATAADLGNGSTLIAGGTSNEHPGPSGNAYVFQYP